MKTSTTLTTWGPLGDMTRIGRSLLGFFPTAYPAGSWIESGAEGDWVPDVEVIEDDKEFTLTADLPDVPRDNIHVSLQNGAITVYGEREPREKDPDLIYHRTERAYGKFNRMFRLPENVTTDKVNAEFRDGALCVHLPKTESTRSIGREIPISA